MTSNRRLQREVGIVAAGWLAYRLVRAVGQQNSDAAYTNARRILEWEAARSIDIEAGMQTLFDNTVVLRSMNVYYLVHFPLTIVCAAVLYRHRYDVYRRFRNTIAAATGAAMLIHATFPLAPPRLVEGYADTGDTLGPSPYSLPGSDAANQLAAMPSMHVGWAVAVALAVVAATSGTSWLRVAAIVHPAITTVVVITTGHHYTADVLVGAALVLTAWAIASHRGRSEQPSSATSSRDPKALPACSRSSGWERPRSSRSTRRCPSIELSTRLNICSMGYPCRLFGNPTNR